MVRAGGKSRFLALMAMLVAFGLSGCAMTKDLLPPPKDVSQIHLTGDHWSPKSPKMRGQLAPFGKTSPFTITVMQVVDSSGRVAFDRNTSSRSLLDSVFLDVQPGRYTVNYVCHVGSYPGQPISQGSAQVDAQLGIRYVVGVFDVVENSYLPPQHPDRRRCTAYFDARTL
ncbi:hypothetical protein [Hydrocarboniphaga effusa]|uniref:hypothetical protein n=2 Tax=Hydrocarboniphaga effusa TaxID=243629 RepID=UPI003BAA645F